MNTLNQNETPAFESEEMEIESDETADVPMIVGIGKDGPFERPATPQEQEQAAQAIERAEQREAQQVEDANEILSLLDPPEKVHVISREITIKGKQYLFNFKKLSFSECAALEGKKYRKNGKGQIIRDIAFEETNSVAWLLYWSIVKNANKGKQDNSGNPLESEWVSMFTLEEIRQRFMGASDPEAQTMLYELTSACWEASPQASPLAQAAALQQMTE